MPSPSGYLSVSVSEAGGNAAEQRLGSDIRSYKKVVKYVTDK